MAEEETIAVENANVLLLQTFVDILLERTSKNKKINQQPRQKITSKKKATHNKRKKFHTPSIKSYTKIT